MSTSGAMQNALYSEAEVESIETLIQYLECVYEELQRVENQIEPKVSRLDAPWRRSVINLLQYIEFRKQDIRPLQEPLACLGLSSLGRAEAHVATTLKAVLRTLYRLAERRVRTEFVATKTVDHSEAAKLIKTHSDTLLGPPPIQRLVRIMVTMPSEAASNSHLVRDFVSAGMNCMRINCAHDDQKAWGAMIANLRQAQTDLGSQCQILMDLAGPKLRTGALRSNPVVKCRPQRDECGRVIAPSRIWLYPDQNPGTLPAAGAHIPLDSVFLKHLTPGENIELTDTRGTKRRLKITQVVGQCRWAECPSTVYFASGLEVRLKKKLQDRTVKIGELPAVDAYILLKAGDLLLLTASPNPGGAAVRDKQGTVVKPATVPCTLPEVFSSVKVGESIALDDGKIRGKIVDVAPEHLGVEITHAGPAGMKLRADKGINLPQSNLGLPALTDDDLAILPFVVNHADMIGISFIERPQDVLQLQKKIRDLTSREPGIVLKIETSRAFQSLPSLIIAAMHYSSAGVMIARGDLAVECGFERMAEIQEEILWLCEAAHMPVIWATQVLETLAKSGQPSRAEVTDAAMGERAECVMLNKGPHILTAIHALNDILKRMEGHQHKKQALLRRLRSWGHAPEVCASVFG